MLVPAASRSSPFPIQTASSSSSPFNVQSRKRKRATRVPLQGRSLAGNSLLERKQIANEASVQDAEEQCQVFSGNDVESCWPTADTIVAQHEWSTFVWNSNLPQFKQFNLLDIYLCDADTSEPIMSFLNTTNPTGQAGWIRAEVDDTFWGSRGSNWNGKNISYPFFWIITEAGHGLDGSQIPQPTFQAVQTTYADSVLAAMSSTSAAIASASAASVLSSISVHGGTLSGTTYRPQPSDGSASIQTGDADSAFPHWAIAVIVILGFLAIVATCMLVFVVLRRIRRNRERSNRNSFNSSSPIMGEAGHHGTTSPLLGAGVAGVLTGASGLAHRDTMTSHDGASTLSRANSADAGPFSGADAAIMADAFRKALRKPDFATAVEEGDSPDTQDTQDTQGRKEELINRELAEEGRGIRSVGSSRGVTVQTLTDAADSMSTTDHRDNHTIHA